MDFKRILITGASGFVGRNLNPYLLAIGHHTIPVKLRISDISQTHLSSSEIIIHLAGKAHDLKNVSNPEDYIDINYRLTKELFDFFILSESRMFIYMSSVKAVTDHPGDNEVVEDDFPAPATAYGKSKLMAEQYLRAQELPDNKKLIILRPCMIHGPGNKGNLNLLYNLISKRIPYPFLAFDNKRSFLSVGNLCFIIGQLITRDDISSGVYNIADDDALSTNRVVEIIAEELFRKPHLWKMSKSLIISLAKLGDRIPLLLNSERLEKLTENYIVSTKKIKTALNTPLPFTSEQGLRLTIQSFNNDRH